MGRGKSSADASSLTAGFAAAGIVTRPGRTPRNTPPPPWPSSGPSLAQLYDMDDVRLIGFLEHSLISDGQLRPLWPLGRGGEKHPLKAESTVDFGPVGCHRGALTAPQLITHYGVGGLLHVRATCVHLKHTGSGYHNGEIHDSNPEMVVFSQRHEATGQGNRCVVLLTDGPHMGATKVRVMERNGDGTWASAGTVGHSTIRKILTQFTVPS